MNAIVVVDTTTRCLEMERIVVTLMNVLLESIPVTELKSSVITSLAINRMVRRTTRVKVLDSTVRVLLVGRISTTTSRVLILMSAKMVRIDVMLTQTVTILQETTRAVVKRAIQVMVRQTVQTLTNVQPTLIHVM
jgi:hypothetical protein